MYNAVDPKFISSSNPCYYNELTELVMLDASWRADPRTLSAVRCLLMSDSVGLTQWDSYILAEIFPALFIAGRPKAGGSHGDRCRGAGALL